jgi:hypothetical protein
VEARTGRIEQTAHDLAEMIRAYCRSQVAIWQEVPYWAHQANGRHGWYGVWTTASEHGYWDIYAEGRGWRWVLAVDLATGEIQRDSQPASDAQVAALAFHLAKLDAAAIVAQLMKTAHKAEIYNGQGHTTEAELAAYKGDGPARPFIRAA